ncbi:hypothetical protein BASA81_017870 [Batrachochytrium salamandrivorans]|nr:hypothetical protein BASA81_017870 [Batrachochytrium salamandrivorans]
MANREKCPLPPIIHATPENWNVARTLNVTTVPVLAGFIGSGALATIASEITAKAVTSDQVFQASAQDAKLGCNRKACYEQHLHQHW